MLCKLIGVAIVLLLIKLFGGTCVSSYSGSGRVVRSGRLRLSSCCRVYYFGMIRGFNILLITLVAIER